VLYCLSYTVRPRKDSREAREDLKKAGRIYIVKYTFENYSIF
jgi:hypothetical protein